MLDHLLKATDTAALIFDMDGTLVDNMQYHRLAFLEWARRLGLRYTEEELMSKTHGTIEEIVRRLFPEEKSEERLGYLGGQKEALYRELYEPHLKLIGGGKKLIHESFESGIPMAVATAGNYDNIGFTLDGLHLRPFFRAIVGGEDVTKGKPDPEVFLLAARKLGIAPQHCLVFEDSPAGVEAASRAEMLCIVINPLVPRDQFGETDHVLHFAKDYYDLEFKLLK